MIRLLSGIFIKNAQDTDSQQVRSAYGVLMGCIGIICNLLLFAFKFTAGWLAKALSLQADAFNNLGDAGSSIVSLLGFRLAAKKPDRDHPYGHGRFEYIAGLFVSVAILLMALSLFRTSIESLIEGAQSAYASHFWLSCSVMICSILVKIYLFASNRALSKKLHSPTLYAVSLDSISDSVATLAVLICALITHFVPSAQQFRLDAICGLLVAVFIFYSGIKSAKETIEPLLGKRPDPSFIEEIKDALLSFEGINGVHDVIVHDYGPGRVFVSLHAEVSADANIREIHDVIDNAEKYLSEAFNCSATIHMDPIVTDDPLTIACKKEMTNALRELDPRLSLHDFRVTTGPDGKLLLFDVVLPYDSDLSEEDITQYIDQASLKIDKACKVIIEFDRGEA